MEDACSMSEPARETDCLGVTVVTPSRTVDALSLPDLVFVGTWEQ